MGRLEAGGATKEELGPGCVGELLLLLLLFCFIMLFVPGGGWRTLAPPKADD